MEVSGQFHGQIALRLGMDSEAVGRQSQSGRRVEVKNLALPGIEPGPSSPYAVAIQTELSRLEKFMLGREWIEIQVC
jgi:hypothetical protein